MALRDAWIEARKEILTPERAHRASLYDLPSAFFAAFAAVEDTGFFSQRERAKLYDWNLAPLLDLLEKEAEAEFEMRKKAGRGYIRALGLREHEDSIIDGANKTCSRVMLAGSTGPLDPLEHRVILHADSDALFGFLLDYVDKWRMYNDLFGKKD